MLETAQASSIARDSGVAITRPRGLIRLTGPQRVWFLQQTITADVDDVDSGSWVESCFLDLKGKVVAHFRVAMLDDEIWIDVDPLGCSPLVDWFTRYRFRTKVDIEDRSGQCVTVVGPQADHLVARGAATAADGSVMLGGVLGDVGVADVHGRAGVPGLPHADEAVLEILRLEAGIPRFGVDYGPHTLPQEAGLTNVVSVTKGCYVGQEVMARLHFRGHVNRCVRPLRFDDDVDPAAVVGAELMHDGVRTGTVTSAGRSPRLGALGIGMVRVVVEEGERLEVPGAGFVEVGPLPPGTKTAKGPPSTTPPPGSQ